MHRAAYLDFNVLPPTPERLMGFPELCIKSGVDTLFLEFGGRFPWSLDGDFLKDSYTEDLISGLFRKLEDQDIQTYLAVRVLDGFRAGTGNTRLSHLAEPPADRASFKAAVRPFLRAAEELKEDIITLVPEITGVYLGGDLFCPSGVSVDEQKKECVRPLCRIFAEEGLQAVLSGAIFNRLGPDCTDPAKTEWFCRKSNIPDRMDENLLWYYVLPDKGDTQGSDRGRGVVGTVTEPFSSPEAALVFFSQEQEDSPFKGLREFHVHLDSAWNILRADREEIARLTLAGCNGASPGNGGTLADTVKAAKEKAAELRKNLGGILQEGPLREYCASRLLPLEEELAAILVQRRYLRERS